ncbi:MAG: GDP-mannose 4,6-dehydratase [Proteobacteria bacterium]|nr:GDP-mannose 4,6-dehydratase [Pseudomonadota bacterium]
MTTSILVTGAAGFIGFHTCLNLLERGQKVIGIDNLNPYYDVCLKKNRLALLQQNPLFCFHKLDLSDEKSVKEMWQSYQQNPILSVIHLGAQAGVRYSIADPFPYVTSNITGFLVILEQARHQKDFRHLVYASTSSVYGENKEMPFTEDQRTDLPISLYAATKKANELMAQSYYHLYKIPLTGLRFFTVYGPWGRPDMSAFKFAHAITKGQAIDIYNNGHMMRDYTYIDDIVDGIIKSLEKSPVLTRSLACHPLYNLGRGHGEKLMDFIKLIEQNLNQEAKKNFLPLQQGDVPETFANISKAQTDLGYSPKTSIHVGVPKLIQWFKEYYYPNHTAAKNT